MMKSRNEARIEYAAEVVKRLKEYHSLSQLQDIAWNTIEDELRYAFSNGVDFAIEKYIHKESK